MKKDHPLYKLRSGLFSRKRNLTLEFSRYVYRRYGETLSREIFHIAAIDVGDEWLANQVESLEDDQELALHSRVRVGSEKANYHIPMIDFIGRADVSNIFDRLSRISVDLKSKPLLYDSGNSFHGYYPILIKEKQWHEFLGNLLLCNLPKNASCEIVDSRWIGHSLIHGFSALRWSKKTNLYKRLPTFTRANKKQTDKTPIQNPLGFE